MLAAQQHLPLVLFHLAKRPNVLGDDSHIVIPLSLLSCGVNPLCVIYSPRLAGKRPKDISVLLAGDVKLTASSLFYLVTLVAYICHFVIPLCVDTLVVGTMFRCLNHSIVNNCQQSYHIRM